MRTLLLATLALASMGTSSWPGALRGADVFQPDPLAVTALAATLPALPAAFGPPSTDRTAWDTIAGRPSGQELVRRMADELDEPLPDLTDELYLDYSKTGNRRRAEAVLFGRRTRVSSLALAECIENQGRFLPPLEAAIQAICEERTWVMPAHDGRLDNFNGRAVTIDLAVAMFAWDLASADRVLADRLSPPLRRRIAQELERRVFEPFRRMTRGEQDPYWLLFDHNWNAVCLAGVTGAALAHLEAPEDRAWFVLAAEKYSRRFLEGFTPDGYCSEGVGYWNYGFGNYVALAEAVRRATGGYLDLLARPDALKPALYGLQIEIVDGVCPPFADCAVDARPDPRLVGFLSSRFGLDTQTEPAAAPTRGSLRSALMELFPSPATTIVLSEPAPPASAPRTWFPDAGVLIGRPGLDSLSRLSVAILGGHNAEHHNHNDVGTFSAVVGRVAVLADIGAEVYTQRTFSGRRYESQALNSFGHAVPLVAGQLQKAGRQAAARLVATHFTDAADSITFDLAAAYEVPALSKLVRRFEYGRTGAGSLTVIDDFEFTSPQTFETALLTFGTCDELDAGVWRIKDGTEAVRVEVGLPPEAKLEARTDTIREDLVAKRPATRLGLRLKEPLLSGSVTLRITPEPAPETTGLPSASPTLGLAAQALADGRLEPARQAFEAILRDPLSLPFVRGLAWCGLARLATAPSADDIERWRARLLADSAVPRGYRDAALRMFTTSAGISAQATDRPGEPDRIEMPDLLDVPARFHVASDGNDADDGSEAKPFRTLGRARDAIRALRQAQGGQVPVGGVRVVVGGGQYPIRETILLGLEDSGATGAPIVYQAKPGETPVFDGGVRLGPWQPIGEGAARGRLPGSVRDRVLEVDLRKLGVTDDGDPTDLRRRPELFIDGAPQTLARWPNEGFVKTGPILGKDTFKVWNSIDGCRDGKFGYIADRHGAWSDEPDVRLYGYWFWDWYEEYQKVARLDPVERSCTLAPPYSQYGYRTGQRYYALNVLRELDEPGEWYLDRTEGKVYWLPPEGVDPAGAEAVLSVLDRPFMVLDEARHVILAGLTFQHARGDGLHIDGGADGLVAGCTLRRLGGDGVVVQGGDRHTLFGCQFDTLGCGGMRIAGGDRQSLAPGRHVVENCTVADISRLKRTYTPAVHLDGCGHRIAHNLFERMPSSALRIEGNDHLIELNLIREVVQESDDQGGVDMFGNPLYRGVVIRWNRWSDIRGGTHNGAAGVRLDDMISGVLVQGNVFERCGAVAFGGVQIHGGKDNWIDGNVFLDCFAGMSFSRWGEKRWLESIAQFLPQAASPAYAARYPELARISAEADVNWLSRNLFIRCAKTFLRDGGVPRGVLNTASSEPFDLTQIAADGGHAGSAALRAILFEPIPVGKIGPYEHPLRARITSRPAR